MFDRGLGSDSCRDTVVRAAVAILWRTWPLVCAAEDDKETVLASLSEYPPTAAAESRNVVLRDSAVGVLVSGKRLAGFGPHR